MSKTLIVVVVLAGGLWYALQQPEFHQYKNKIVDQVWQSAEKSTSKTRKFDADRLYEHFESQLYRWSEGADAELKEISDDTESIYSFHSNYCKEDINYHPVFSEDELSKVCREAASLLDILPK